MGHPSFRCHDNKNLCRNDDPFHYTALICVLDSVCPPPNFLSRRLDKHDIMKITDVNES